MASAVEVRDAGSKGHGVFALRSIARGDIIFEFMPGRLVSEEEIATSGLLRGGAPRSVSRRRVSYDSIS